MKMISVWWYEDWKKCIRCTNRFVQLMNELAFVHLMEELSVLMYSKHFEYMEVGQ